MLVLTSKLLRFN